MSVNLRPSVPAQAPTRPPSSITGPKPIVTTAPAAIQAIQKEQVEKVLQASAASTTAAERHELLTSSRAQMLDVQRLHALEQRVNQMQETLKRIANAPTQTSNMTIHNVNRLKGWAQQELRRQR